MGIKKLLLGIMAVALFWSCSRDDGPSSFGNQPPVIYDQTFNLQEKVVTEDQAVGIVKAYDSNIGTKLTFSITTNSDDMFEIEAATGLLGVKAGKTLDLADTPLRSITVAVTDGERADSAQITICDCTPHFSNEYYVFEVSEDISDDELIHNFEIADVDTDFEDLVFTIHTNDSGLFEISSSGELTLSTGKNLDYETATEHNIIVSVTDGTETIEVAVKILVLNVIEGLADDPASFVTKWQTQSDGEKIVIGANSNYDYDFTVDWGDGTVEDVIQMNPETFEHTYEVAGEYTVAIEGGFPAIQMINSSTADKLMSIEQWGNINWKDFSFAFADCTNMFYQASDSPKLSEVTSLEGMFMDAVSFTADLNDWDTSSVTNMSHAFRNATSFNGDIGDWNTSNVTQMQYMFDGAILFNKDLDDWVTSNVVNMANMFRGATAFNGNIDNWNTANVDVMTTMFENATDFNRNIVAWETGNVTFMIGMFRDAESFNGNIADWDTGNVESMANMFNGATSFNRNIGNWDISNVTNMQGMLDNSGMTPTSYGLTLQFWAQDGNVPSNITLGALGLQVDCDFAAMITARDYLINTESWIITDTPCP
ncbi:BspA family leucine-rich repeat surface protein [Flagellimonas crocea]|uniref:BspA family leucine-rich repeat surface protein n=1 Tax=Flagellimonas crocea TaxID=3067311 RepID=UPI00296F7DD0|nr:BspA family leucine-rich repeat surface protein [Muricauda sp. DH64]